MLLRRCCFVMPLRVGAGVAAFLTLVFSVYFLIMGAQTLVEYLECDVRSDEDLLDLLLYFALFALGITMFIFLYVGLINELPSFLLYWLIGMVVIMAILISYAIYQYIDDRELDSTDFILIGMLLVWVYLWLVVLSYKAELTEC